jgi:titin
VNNDNGFGAYPQNAQRLTEDVVNLVDPIVDFSQYDSDNDGTVEGLFIIHSGRGAEYGGGSGDIWSHAWGTHTQPHLDGVWIRQYSMEPEYWSSYGDMTCGVYAHEMGHAVFGLPDFYDTGYDSRGLGKWSLMAGGSWNGSLGNSPAHPDAWSRVAMGVVSVTNITSSQSGVSIPRIETTPTIFRLWTGGAAGTQYFLVENRQQTGYDAGIPSNGLLIYHIDDAFRGNNSQWYPGMAGTSHYQVAIEPADGAWHLEHNNNDGDSGDPFPGSSTNRNFNDATTPNSRNYASASTWVSVNNISNSGATMTADFSVSSCSPPDQVTGLSATTDRCSDVQLSWTDVTGATGFRVYRNGTQIGSDQAAHTVSYTDASGTPGTSYNYTVAALLNSCVGTASAAAAGSRLSGPSQVSGVGASTTRCADIQISWTDQANETGYKVFRNGVQLGADRSANTTSITDTSVTPGTWYTYYVQAFNGSCTGTASASVSGVRLITPLQVTGVSATQDRCNDVVVTWTNAANESGYRVLRNGTQIGSDLAVNTTSYTDAAAVAGVTYSYSVIAINGACAGPVSVTASGLRTGGPAQVAGVSATSNRCADVLISWTALAGVSGYRVYRNGTQIGSDLGAGITSYTDAAGTAGVTYNYTVAALSGSCLGPVSAASQGARLSSLAQVTGVAATSNHCSDITVTWTDVAAATGFRVYRDGTQVGGDLAAHVTTYVDQNALAGYSYAYTVLAFSASCSGPLSSAASGMMLTRPAQVTGVTATSDRCSDVLISWTDLSGETGYRVFRNGTALSADLAANRTSYSDASATAGVVYTYTVVAFNGSCDGTASASRTGQRLTVPAQITNVAATTNRCSDIRVTWTDAGDGIVCRVYRNGTQVSGDLTAHTTSFDDVNVTSGVSFNYTVVGYSGTCAGTTSATAAGLRLSGPAAAANFAASSDRCGDIRISWTDLSTETGYRLYRDGVQLGADLPANTNAYLDSTAVPGVSYSYSLTAFNAACSGASSVARSGMRVVTPAMVTGVSATTDRCLNVLISWTDLPNESSYRVYRNGVAIGSVLSTNTTSFLDSTGTAGTTYAYTVIASNGNCPSPVSAAASGLRLPALAQVTGVTASRDRCREVYVAWTTVANATGYRIFRNSVLLNGELPAGTSSYSDSTCVAGLSNSYTIQAYRNACDAVVSSPASGYRISAPITVAGVLATQDRCSDIVVSWTGQTGIGGYRIYRNGVLASGNLSAQAVSFTDTSAVPGTTYAYAVAAYNGSCESIASNPAYGVRLVTPTQVQGVSASADRCSDITVSWLASNGAAGYRVYRNGVPLSGDLPAAARTYVDATAVSGNSYSYAVLAFNGACLPPLSAAAAGSRTASLPAVTGITASVDRCADIQLSWTAMPLADSVQIRRNGLRIGAAPAGVRVFTDVTAAPGSYTYQLIPYNVCGAGDSSGTASGRRRDIPPSVTVTTATQNRCSDVFLTWQSVASVTGYTIVRNGDSLASVASDVNTFNDRTAFAGENYSYSIRSFNDCGPAAASPAVIGWRPTAPATVTGVAASTDRCDSISIVWTLAPDVTAYRIYQNGTQVGSTFGSVGRFVTAPVPGSYQYTVTAENLCGSSAASLPVTGTRWETAGTPRNLTASVDHCGWIQLGWSAASGHVDYYEILRDDAVIGTASSPSYADSIGGTHSYRVRTVNTYCGNSPLTLPVQGTALDVVAAVSSFTVSPVSCSQIEMSWSAVSGAEGYVVRRDTDSIAVIAGGTLTFIDHPSVPGLYSYTVTAFNRCGQSAESTPELGELRTLPPVAADVTATQTECRGVLIAWIPTRGETGFAIYRNGDSIGSVAASQLQFEDAAAVPGIMYAYTVRSFNACGLADPSSPAAGMRRAGPLGIDNLVVTSDRCDSVVATWTGLQSDAAYLIFRDGVEIGEVASTVNRFADSPDYGDHAYTVVAQNLCGRSEPSAPVTGSRPESVTAPASVAASDTLCGFVSVSWAPSAGSVQSYEVLRNGLVIATVPSGTTSYTDSVTDGLFAYSIAARGACGDRPVSVEDTGTGYAEPGVPLDVILTAEECSPFRLSWTPARGSIVHYIVYRDGVAIDSIDNLIFSDTTLTDPGNHVYQVAAWNPYCGAGVLSAPMQGGLTPLAEFTRALSDTVQAADTLQLELGHCDGVTVDSLFLMVPGHTVALLGAFEPVQSLVRVSLPPLDSAYTPDCRILLTARRGTRVDSIWSVPFIVHTRTPDAVSSEVTLVPADYILEQNYPNPFNPSTTIRFSVPRGGDVKMDVLDILGRKVATLVDGFRAQGNYSVQWSCSDCATGVYLLRMTAGDKTMMKKMMLLR